MKEQAGGREITLDEAIAAVRDDRPPASTTEAAGARVWARVAQDGSAPGEAGGSIRGCADVQALFPALRQASLPAPRALLVEDHLRECAPCRAAFRQPGRPRLAILPWRPAAPTATAGARSWRRPALAAASLAALALSGFAVQRVFFGVPPGSRASVQSVSGVLQRVALERTPTLAPGEELGEAESVRTARDSQARLRLRDGSMVEMGERAELFVTARGNDTTIHLQRGRIIVQAARRRTGHLLVASNDCTVQVTGTVFSVNSSVKGSRVSVIEGNVRVFHGRSEESLRPGEQFATSTAMGTVPLQEEIAWSRDLDQHLALLAEFKALRQKLDTLPAPGLRYESRLLRLLPENTVVFASAPNYGEALAEAHRLFEQRLQESAVLREWWEKAEPARHGGPSLNDVIDKVHGLSGFLGDEVAFAAVTADGRPRPLLLAEVRRPGLDEFLARELGEALRHVLLRGNVVAFSDDPAMLRALEGALETGSGFEQSPFGQRIADAYREGVGLLFAADLERIGPQGNPAVRATGIDDLRYLIAERKGLAQQAQSRALLAFSGQRRGIASWLAAPGPMGALDFVSPGAEAAAAFVTKSPALVLDDILGLRAGRDAEGSDPLAMLESKLNLRLREDVAEALGSDFAVALDGPILPTPAWKLAVEVYDAARLQAAVRALVDKAGEEMIRAGRPAPRLEAEQVGAQTYYSIRGGVLPFEVHYTFADGYLVAAPARALVMQALRTHETGDSLPRSAGFRAMLPADGRDHASGLIYQNLGPFTSALLDVAGSAQLTPEQRQSFESLARDARPTLVSLYGEEDAIRMAGTGGFIDLDPTAFALPMLLQRALPGTGHQGRP
ncbi:MAG TPA: FecR family protein [Vicinamibacteria bacterium]